MSRGVAVPVRGGVVLAGGLLPGDLSTGQAYRITLPAGHLHRLPALGTTAHDAAGALLGGRPAVFGGGGSTELSVVQRLGADGSWHAVGRLPGARSDLSAVSYDGGVVVIGGYDGSRSPRTILRTEDGRRVTRLGALPRGLRYAAVAVVGDTAWVMGGEEDGHELDEVYAVDLRTGRVRPSGRLPHPLGHAATAVVGDRVLVMGGRTSPGRTTDAMWWFQPATGRWRPAGHLPYPVADAPTVTTSDGAYLLGGETPGFTDRVTRVLWR
jgi:N-acetylneuraminic acid mutarotase